MPISDVRVVLVTFGQLSSLLLLLLLHLFPLRLAQNLPTSQLDRSNNVYKNEQETFLNSYVVEAELEKSVYLFHRERQQFVFFVKKGYLSVVVTPCASKVTWSLNVNTDTKQGYRGYRRKKNSKKVFDLGNYTTESRQRYTTFDAIEGIYSLNMTSLHSDSYARIFVTRNPSPTSGSTYPILPSNPSVSARLKKRTLYLAWPSGTSVNQWVAPVEYCVSISQIKNFKTHCSLLAHKLGDKPPRYVRWRHGKEGQKIRRLRNKANPIRKVKRRLLHHQCVGNKTTLSYPKIKRGRKYFIDVFIVNSKTNQTSTYEGTSIERKKRKRSKKYFPLVFGQTKTISLKKNKGFEVNLNHTVSRLVFEVVPCSGKVTIAMSEPRKKRRKKGMARQWKRIIVRRPKAGVYRMTFPGKRRKSSFVTVSLASKYNKKSNVILPKKRNIKIHKDRTSCSNVTLEWAAESSSHDYCVYKRPLGRGGKDARKYSCLSPSERPVSERVLCGAHQSQSSSKSSFHVQSVDIGNLRPATWYRFDVFLRFGQSLMMPYKSVKEKTKDNCNHS